MTNKTIQYKEVIRRQRELRRVQSLGVELVHKKSMIKIVLGSCLAGLGLITLPLPTGSVVLIAVGLSLMASGGVDVWGYKKDIIRRIKLKWWAVCRWKE